MTELRAAPSPKDAADGERDVHDVDVAAAVLDVLRQCLQRNEATLGGLDTRLADVTAAIDRLIAAGGKRLRPAFVYWGHRATGAAHDEQVLHAAAALEMLHTFALLHDDVMDRSAMRRRLPTAQHTFGRLHTESGWSGDAEWFGVSAAVLAGDLALVLADDLIDAMDVCPSAWRRGRKVFSALRTEVMAGQYLDLVAGSDPSAGERMARRVALLKSARYTVTRPLLLGSALADPGAAAGVEAALAEYGDALGVAFQLRDDVLGLFGDPEVTGKGVCDDLRGGKRTLLLMRAERLADSAQRQVLRRHVGDSELTEDAAAEVRQVVAATGALASVEALISAEHERAVAALVTVAGPARRALAELADGAVRRSS